MTDVNFYHLQRSSLESTLPKLLEKILQAGKRAVVMARSEERVAALNALLWTYDPNSFLPHGSRDDGNAPDQPVWLTAADENPNAATVLVLTDGAETGHLGDYERCLELFDGNDPERVAEARRRWTGYKQQGHAVTYWQQAQRGWEKKA
ncbi:MAG: DNA polymerase III subunit chi [Rhodospirillaceae bacterium]|nr:DNA polymerase III subunit chi [Rhodospirillaceae bacterium]